MGVLPDDASDAVTVGAVFLYVHPGSTGVLMFRVERLDDDKMLYRWLTHPRHTGKLDWAYTHAIVSSKDWLRLDR